MALRTIEGGAGAPPHSVEAERQVLGTCILRPSLLAEIDLSTQQFFLESHARIWSALQYLAAEGLEVDGVHLRERLVELGQLASVGGDDYLLGLTDTVPDVAPADIVRKLARQRGVQALGRRLAKAGEAGDLTDAQAAVREAQRTLDEAERRPVVEWRSALDVFAPLPPVPWRVRGLQICPGRPSMLAGYGASAKTLSAQAMALACASGRPVWGHFDVHAMHVRHLDYEQGWHATARRYQRLAYGHGIDPREVESRLSVAVFPSVHLDQSSAEDAYSRLCDGADLVVIDSLKASSPTQDENDSRIRVCVDVLTRVSAKTGCAFVLIHHAGKPQEGHRDARTLARGSSAIFDAAGSVFTIAADNDPAEPRTVRHVKSPAEAEGMPVPDFLLDVLDVHAPGMPSAGVRVAHKAIPRLDPAAASSARYDAQQSQLLAVIHRNPGLSASEIIARAGINKQTGLTILESLGRRGAVRVSDGPRNAMLVYPSNSQQRPNGDTD